MARTGAAGAAPQIVIVDDGKPVEKVSSTARIMAIIKIGVMILAPLVVGYIFGGINTKNAGYNKMIGDTKTLYGDFEAIGKGLQGAQDALDAARDRAGGKQIRWDDDKLVDDLAALKLQAIDPTVLFHSNLYNLDPAVVTSIYGYYMDLNLLNTEIAEYVAFEKGTKKKAYRFGLKLQQAQNPPTDASNNNQPVQVVLGAVVHIPKPDDANAKVKFPYFELVQLGYPKCKKEDKDPSQCPEGTLPYSYKQTNMVTGIQWSKDAVVYNGKDNIGDGTVLLFSQDVGAAPADPNNNVETTVLGLGPEKWVDAQMGNAKLQKIIDDTKDLAERRAKMKSVLNSESQRTKRFSL
jgi:hypothetical protein